MSSYGYLKICAMSPATKPGDPMGNARILAEKAAFAEEKGAGLVVFPELALCGCDLGDLFYSESLQRKTDEALHQLSLMTANLAASILVGTLVEERGRLYGGVALLQQGMITTMLTGENETLLVDPANEFTIAVRSGDGDEGQAYEAQLEVIAGSRPALGGGHQGLLDTLKDRSRRQHSVCVFAGAGPSSPGTDAVFSGECVIAEDGQILADCGILQEDAYVIADADLGLMRLLQQQLPAPVVVPEEELEIEPLRGLEADLDRVYSKEPFLEGMEEKDFFELFEIQSMALAQRLKRSYSKGTVIGVSGGSDSTLAILVCARAAQILSMDPSTVLAVTMPGFGTTGRTRGNAYGLMESLGCQLKEIPIGDSVAQHLKDIGHDIADRNVTYENAQARERTQVLMDLANDSGRLVVGTGDLSEIALGWCTYGGDQLSMYGVNGGLTKGLVKAVIGAVSSCTRRGEGPFGQCIDRVRLCDALDDVLATPVSPELLPPDENGSIAQITEDKVGPYELHDFILWHMVHLGKSREKTAWLAKQTFRGMYEEAVVDQWLEVFCRRLVSQQFKRDCSAGCPQVLDFSFSPRTGWLMPSDASGNFWK